MSQINLQRIVTTAKQPGLFWLKSYSPKGYYLEPLDGGTIRFVANERGRVLALGNIDLAVKDGSINLLEVFQTMEQHDARIPPVADREQVRHFFHQLIPELDQRKVAMSHLVKVITWYHLMTRKFNMKKVVNEKDDGLMII